MTTVTTLIPVYNGERFIAEAIDSVLNQCGVDVELIVIDDESTDSTPQILESYGNRIRVLRQKNGGHVNARNNGAKLATGNWLAFLDADDAWFPDKLAKQLAAAGEEIGMVYTDRENFGDLSRVARIQSESVQQFEGDIFEPLLFGNFITVASVIMRRDWFDRLGGFDESLKVCEDWDMWLRYSAAGGRTALVREPLTRYRFHSESMSNNQERMREGRHLVVERALASERSRSLSRSVRRKARASVWSCSAWHAMGTRRMTAFRWYLRAALNWPWNLAIYKQMLKCCLGRA